MAKLAKSLPAWKRKGQQRGNSIDWALVPYMKLRTVSLFTRQLVGVGELSTQQYSRVHGAVSLGRIPLAQ